VELGKNGSRPSLGLEGSVKTACASALVSTGAAAAGQAPAANNVKAM
jgi:hypothetical protein